MNAEPEPNVSRQEDLDSIVEALSDRGHAGSTVEEMVRSYQAHHGLAVTGRPDAATLDHLARPRCGLPDALAVRANGCQWPIRDLTYWQSIAFPGVDPAEIAQDYAWACDQWRAVCGLTFAPASSPDLARIVAVPGPIDGPFNVLALSELPCGATPASVMHQTFDFTESALTRAQRRAMMAHELGHAIGLDHSPANSGNLMDPVLSSITTPQPGYDIPEAQARYGPPRPVPTPAPAPAPTPAPAPSPRVPDAPPPQIWPDGTVIYPTARTTIGSAVYELAVVLRPARSAAIAPPPSKAPSNRLGRFVAAIRRALAAAGSFLVAHPRLVVSGLRIAALALTRQPAAARAELARLIESEAEKLGSA